LLASPPKNTMRPFRNSVLPLGEASAPGPVRSRGGFSLLEMLVILGIIALLVSLALPSFNSMSSARSLAQGAYDAATFLELARSEAVTRRTYVWVGFQNTRVGLEQELQIGAVYSSDGTSDSSPDNLQSLTRTLRVKRATLTPWSDLKSATRALLTGTTPQSVASNANGVSFNVGSCPFSQSTVTFTPMGQAMLKGSPTTSDGYIPLMDVSIRQTHGATAQPTANDVAIILNGATGASRVLRLE
jgi:Tfp pilus assembly protein FimT